MVSLAHSFAARQAGRKRASSMSARRWAARDVDPRERAAASLAETLAIVERYDGPCRQRAEAIAAALANRGDTAVQAVLDGFYQKPEPRPPRPPPKGSGMSPEARAKIGAARKGKPLSAEHRARIGAAIRAAREGQPLSPAHPARLKT